MIAPPRPILKTRHNSSNLNEYFPSPSSALPFRFPTSPHVHFPPTPTLTDTQMTHSPFVYDRAPIIVLPNACKLPERGGRNYSTYGIMTASPSMASRRRRNHFDRSTHPQHEDENGSPPPLVHDHPSESEDADACISISSPAFADELDSALSITQDVDITTMDSGTALTPITPPRTSAFLPPVPEHQARPLCRPKLKRKHTGLTARMLRLGAVEDTFAGEDRAMSLDGCLGGF